MRKSFCRLAGCASIVISSMVLINGCATPDVSHSGGDILPDDRGLIRGGMDSVDVRTFASKVAPGILGCEEIAAAPGPVVVKVANFKNTSRFFIDADLFMKRLRLELNRFGGGRIRVQSNNGMVQGARVGVIKERQEEQVRAYLKKLAAEIAANPQFNRPGNPVKIAVAPVLNTNLVNMNADSFSVMLRAEIAKASQGRILFLMPGEMKGADYYLTGQFVPESMKKEGIINLSNYIDIIDERVRQGKPLDTASIVSDSTSSTSVVDNSSSATTTTTRLYEKERILTEMLHNPAYRANPNVNKHLNVMIARPSDKVVVFEDMFLLDRKMSDQSGRANYILSGEISGMSQSRGGLAQDYLLISAQLTDPETNEIVWEDAIEVKRATQEGIVYR